MAPKAMHVLIPGLCDPVTLLGKMDFAGINKFRLFCIIWVGPVLPVSLKGKRMEAGIGLAT